MEIKVKNNDAVKAYRVLMRKINKEYNNNYFRFLRSLEKYTPKSEEKRIRKKKAINEQKKSREAFKETLENEEKLQLVDSKKRAKDFKKQQNKNQSTKLQKK